MTQTKKPKRWSQEITDHSDALDFEDGVFTRKHPSAIARSLMRSAEASERQQADPYITGLPCQYSLSISTAGKSLDDAQKQTLKKAKDELRKLYGKD